MRMYVFSSRKSAFLSMHSILVGHTLDILHAETSHVVAKYSFVQSPALGYPSALRFHHALLKTIVSKQALQAVFPLDGSPAPVISGAAIVVVALILKFLDWVLNQQFADLQKQNRLT